jgi:hypothetical protein
MLSIHGDHVFHYFKLKLRLLIPIAHIMTLYILWTGVYLFSYFHLFILLQALIFSKDERFHLPIINYGQPFLISQDNIGLAYISSLNKV